MSKYRSAWVVGLVSLLQTAVAWADAPGVVPVQGYLTDADGTPIDGGATISFAVYTTETGGRPLFAETQEVLLETGYFTAYVGDVEALDLALFRDNGTLFLGVTVGDDEEMAPRFALGSVPFAGFAQYAGAVAWDDVTGVPGDVGDGDDDTRYEAGMGLLLDETTFSVDTATIQARVEDSCAAGQAIRAIALDGSVTCTGGVAYSAGFGLDLAGTTFSVDTGEIQARVAGSCGVGNSIRVIAADGSVTCEADTDTTYAPGFGLDLAGTTFSVDTAEVQQRVTGSCAIGSSIRLIAAGGTVTCETDDNTTYSAGFGIDLAGTTFSADLAEVQRRVTGSCAIGSSIRLIAADGTVTCEADDLGDPTPDTIADDGRITLGVETSGSYDATPDTIADDGTITLGVETTGGYDATPDTIADDGVIVDAEVADSISVNNTRLYAPAGAGSVGIGTAAPTSTLEVDGRVTVGSEGSFTNIYETELLAQQGNIHVIGNEDAGGQAAGTRTRLRVGNAWNYAGIYAETATNGANHSLMLGASDAHVRIQGANAGLHWTNTGTWAGSAGWDPNPGSAAGLFLEAAPNEAAGLYLDGDLAAIWSPGDPDLFRIYDEDGMIERFRVDGIGNLRVAVGTLTGCVQDGDGTVIAGVCASDARLKRDVRAFDPVLDRLVQLQPVHFHWRPEVAPDRRYGPSESFGLVAQDVQRVLPELVVEDHEGYLAVRYNELPLTMLQAMKEEHARVGEVSGRVGRLERENRDLRSRLGDMDRRLASLSARRTGLASIADHGSLALVAAFGFGLVAARFRRRPVR